MPRKEKERWDGLIQQWESEISTTTPTPKPKKKKASRKWSPAAKARNRQRLLRKRIEKSHGYDSEKPGLFDSNLLAKIESEFQQTITERREYFIDGVYPNPEQEGDQL